MSSAAEPKWWYGARFWMLAGTLFFVQLGLIFVLSDRRPARVRQASFAPGFRLLLENQNEYLRLMDPTLFALPRQQNFSGPAWLFVPKKEFQPDDWSEPPRWLAPDTAKLGTVIASLVQSNIVPDRSFVSIRHAELALPLPGSAPPLQGASAIRLEEGLAEWKLLTPIELPPRANSDLLTNTIVQVVVDRSGQPMSVVLLSGSGLPEADLYAIEQSRRALFAPPPEYLLHPPASFRDSLTWGQLVFEWRTVPQQPSAAPNP